MRVATQTKRRKEGRFRREKEELGRQTKRWEGRFRREKDRGGNVRGPVRERERG